MGTEYNIAVGKGFEKKDLEDVLIVEEIKAGNSNSFGKIYSKYYKYILKKMTFLCNGDVELAEDLTSKVFEKVIKKLAGGGGEYNKTYEFYDENDVFSPEDMAKVHICLQKLPPEYREVLMLRFLEQMSYQQISQVLNCKLGTVRSRLHYAKIALRKELEK